MPWAKEVYLASAVIPMGWLNAVSLFQHLHRRLGFEEPPCGTDHAESVEWRRDRPVPISATVPNGEWVQCYLDDYDCPEFVFGDVFRGPCLILTFVKGLLVKLLVLGFRQRSRDT